MVMFAALILGSRLGALSQFLYLIIGLLGLPVFAHGGGPGYVLQPSFGFIIGFIPGAYLMGKIVEGSDNLTFWRTVGALITGQIIIYVIGVSYLYLNLNYIIQKPISLFTTIKIGFLIFIPGDILKTIIASTVILPVRKRLILYQQ
jgi:biotin transport system substrate-specific component